MNTYARYVHIFFGVLLLIPLLIVISAVESVIVVIFSVIAIGCAIAGAALIIRGVAAPSLPSSDEKPKKVQSSTS